MNTRDELLEHLYRELYRQGIIAHQPYPVPGRGPVGYDVVRKTYYGPGHYQLSARCHCDGLCSKCRSSR